MSLSSQNPKSNTAISAKLIINIPELGVVGHKVEGFGADDAVSFEEVDTTEVFIGVDGQLVAGFIPQLKTMRLTLAATSASLTIFNRLYQEMEKREEVVWIQSAVLILPAIRQGFALTNGALSGFVAAPNVKKTLQSVPVRIVWDSVKIAANG